MRKTLPLLMLVLTGCASSSKDITPAYVSPFQYSSLSCIQLAQEAQGVSRRAIEVTGSQDSHATSDAAMTAVAVVVFWPALFALKGDNQTAAELAQLKGQMNAIEEASIQKKCNIAFEKTASAGR